MAEENKGPEDIRAISPVCIVWNHSRQSRRARNIIEWRTMSYGDHESGMMRTQEYAWNFVCLVKRDFGSIRLHLVPFGTRRAVVPGSGLLVGTSYWEAHFWCF